MPRQFLCQTTNTSILFSELIHHRYGPSQADVVSFKAFKDSPTPAKYPHAYRWYKHLATYEPEFSSLPGDPSKAYTTYGPQAGDVTLNPAKAPAADDDDDMDLFGSDDEEEDAEAAEKRKKNLEEYQKKKAGKTKPAAKSIVTLDVKPWGMSLPLFTSDRSTHIHHQTTRPT